MAAFGGIDDWDHEAESSDNFWRRFKEAQTGARARARLRARLRQLLSRDQRGPRARRA